MDAISYGLANKAGASEKKTRGTTLAEGVEGNHPNVKSRIDSLEKAFEGLTLKANQMIVNDAINIMKANAKLNAIAKTTRYKMQNMIFDDLLDLSGINMSLSKAINHTPSLGLVEGEVIHTTIELTDVIPTKSILISEEQKGSTEVQLGKYFISRDAGATWESIIPNMLFYFDDKVSPQDKAICLKIELPVGVQLLNYALTWA